MNKRRTDDEVTRLLKDADRDMAAYFQWLSGVAHGQPFQVAEAATLT